MTWIARLLWAALLPALWAGTAGACQICVPLPERTLADRLLQSDAVVLAREDAARPFHYRPVATLFGEPGDAPIELFLHSQARRVLAADPERAMVLAHDPRDDSWTALGFNTPELERVVGGILARSGQWRPRENANRERLHWFVPLLGHPDERLHELAYLEIGRAPYAEIRRLAPRIDPEMLNEMLANPRYLEWQSLAILILGESGQEQDQVRVRETLAEKARLGISRNLAAWATALVAVDGTAGVERLQGLYACHPGRSRDELDAVIQALSVHATAEPALRAPVANVYRRLLDCHPALAPAVVHDLIAWQHWDFAERIREIQQDLADDPLAAYALGLYLRSAIAHAPLVPASNQHGSNRKSLSDQRAQENSADD
jgi:hypothetical protein